ncbi:MAG: AgmX/PglI C-terminal domain-containing protein [Kofleriaceae bacterium]
MTAASPPLGSIVAVIAVYVALIYLCVPPQYEPDPDVIVCDFAYVYSRDASDEREQAIELARNASVLGEAPDPASEPPVEPAHSPLHWLPQPRAVHASVTVTGNERFIVKRYLKRNLLELERCYRSGLAENTELRTMTTARFEIRANGQIAEVRVDAAHDPIAACIATAIRGVSFPATYQSEHVAATLAFRP